MEDFRTDGREMITSFWRNRSLLFALTKREVISRYQGSMLGLAWSFFNPILLLIVYTFIFSVIFKARWSPTENASTADFSLILFVGLIVHGMFAECVQRAPNLILSNVNYVKKVIFPLEILPWVAFFAALFHACISFSVLLIALLIIHKGIHLSAVLFPIILIPLALGTLGISWFLAGLGVYIRDTSQVTSMIVTILLFMSPVFYPISALPEKYQWIANLNPVAFVIESSRGVLIFGTLPDWNLWIILTASGATVAWLGFLWFQKTRKGFADVL